jgi:hypothetical protein
LVFMPYRWSSGFVTQNLFSPQAENLNYSSRPVMAEHRKHNFCAQETTLVFMSDWWSSGFVTQNLFSPQAENCF